MTGPDGAAPTPPDWLHDRPLPLCPWPATRVLNRIHRLVHGPVFFGPGPGQPPANRFDPTSGRFGVLYAAAAFEAALIETLLRNPARLMVSAQAIRLRAHSRLCASRDLRLVDATGAGLSKIGTDARLCTGPYAPCGAWADALWDHPDAPDGLLYPSRHDPHYHCVALFQRPGLTLTALETRPLPRLQAQVAEVLDRHGKSLSGPI